MRPRILASIRSVDPLQIGDGCRRLLDADVDGLHVDIADGVFVPELTFGPHVVAAVLEDTAALVDVHLMVSRPERYLPELAKAGVIRLSFHLEAEPYPWRVCSLARSLGMEVGVALNPATPLTLVEPVVRAVDFVNLLTTELDFAGERLLPGSAERVAAARTILPAGVRLEVDGGINSGNAAALVHAGADELVVGRAITGPADWGRALAELRDLFGGERAEVNSLT
jgi:ribulose-phosphate 3-epimerase